MAETNYELTLRSPDKMDLMDKKSLYLTLINQTRNVAIANQYAIQEICKSHCVNLDRDLELEALNYEIFCLQKEIAENELSFIAHQEILSQLPATPDLGTENEHNQMFLKLERELSSLKVVISELDAEKSKAKSLERNIRSKSAEIEKYFKEIADIQSFAEKLLKE